MNPWFTLLLAGLLEIAFAASLGPSDGFTRLWPSVSVVVFGAAEVVMLSRALAHIPVSTAYAVFTGIGAVGTVIVGIVAFGDPSDLRRLLCIALVLTGVLGLHLSSPPV